MESQNEYHLIFEGPQDESDRTLQQIKGVFIGELDFPMSDVQQFLASAPITIKTASTEEDLEGPMQALKRAGAKVTIVTPQTRKEDSSEESMALPSQVDATHGDDEPLFEMVLEGDELFSVEKPSPKLKEPKVYTLSLEESEDAALFSAEMLAQNPVVESTDETSEVTLGPTSNLTLEGSVLEDPAALSLTNPASEEVRNQVDTGKSTLLELGVLNSPTRDSEPVKEEAGSQPVDEPFDLSIQLEDDCSLSLPSSPLYTGSTSPSDYVQEPETFDIAPASQEPSKARHTSLDSDQPQEPRPLATGGDEIPEPLDLLAEHSPTIIPPPPQETSTDARVHTSSAPVHQEASPKETGLEGGREKSEKKKSSKKKSNLGRELLTPILIGSAILGVANWYYLSSTGPDPQVSTIQNKLQKSLKEIKKEQVTSAKAVETQSPLRDLSISSTFDTYSASAKLQLDGERILKMILVLQTSPPAELTKEQIVAGEIKPPWLRKIEGGEISLREAGEKGSFQADGPAFAYIEYRGEQKRIAVNMKLGLTLHTDKGTLEVRYQFVNQGTPPPQELGKLQFEQSGESFIIAVSGVLEGLWQYSDSSQASSAANSP